MWHCIASVGDWRLLSLLHWNDTPVEEREAREPRNAAKYGLPGGMKRKECFGFRKIDRVVSNETIFATEHF